MDIVEDYFQTYISWKQSQYSQKTYNKLIDLYDRMSVDQRAQVSKKLVGLNEKRKNTFMENSILS